MSWAGAYSLDLYCDKRGPNLPGQSSDGVHVWDEFPHQYVDESGSVCRTKARKAGWIISSDGAAICPKCSGKKRTNPAAQAATDKSEDTAPLVKCAAARDGDCSHKQCPQLRDSEPRATGRHCPLDTDKSED